ncbi:MAG: DUF4003 family protein [Clostridium chrysemydis]|uniref:DUF4003 family protein n=1 Tax=Clostridium chrysemydis TaxID=2665504 RepID=UPI003F370843
MDIELKEKVKVYIEFLYEFKKNMRCDKKEIASLGALISSETNESLDFKKVKEIRKYIKGKTKFNSPFRGKFSKVFSTIMNDREDYKEVFNNTRYIYDMLLLEGITPCQKLIYASFLLSKRVKEDELKDSLERFKKILSKVSEIDNLNDFKKDYLLISYLSLMQDSFIDIYENVKLIDKCFDLANIKDVSDSELFYYTLLISEEDPSKLEGELLESKIEKALRIKCLLMRDDVSFDNYIYALIGLASNFIKDEDVFVKGVNSIYNTLSESKRFRKFKVNETQTFKTALNIVLERYVEYIKGDIIDIEFNSESYIRIIEEYVMLSIGIK